MANKREKVEIVKYFIFLSSQISVGGDCGHEIKRWLVLGRKAMINLDSLLKSRDITLPPKFSIVKAMVFPTVMYGCKSWTMKKAEHQRIDAFQLWFCRRLLRVHWTARRSNQSILKKSIFKRLISLWHCGESCEKKHRNLDRIQKEA